MSVFVVASGQTPLSLTTFSEMKRLVAGVLSRESDDPDDLGAGDAIRLVLGELNSHCWDYLSVQGTDITLVDESTTTLGQEGYRGQYTMPTPIRDFVSLKVDFGGGTTGGVPLDYVDRMAWDQMVKTSSGLGTRFFSTFEHGTTAKIELLDFPSQAGRMEVRYYRPITIPTNGEERMDLPRGGPLETAVVYLARALVATDAGSRTKSMAYEQRGRYALSKALGKDRRRYLQDTTWRPLHERVQHQPAEQKRFESWGTNKRLTRGRY